MLESASAHVHSPPVLQVKEVNGKTHSKAPKIQRLVTPLTLQRKRRRVHLKRERIAKVRRSPGLLTLWKTYFKATCTHTVTVIPAVYFAGFRWLAITSLRSLTCSICTHLCERLKFAYICIAHPFLLVAKRRRRQSRRTTTSCS